MIYNPTSNMIGQVIDCRQLTLTCEFNDLTYEQASDLLMLYSQYVSTIFDQHFSLAWSVKNRSASTKNIVSRSKQSISPGQYSNVFFEAFCITPAVYNRRSYLKYVREMDKLYMNSPLCYNVSCDYPAYWMQQFPNDRCSNEEFLEKVKKIFGERNRKLSSLYMRPDGQGLIRVDPYQNNPEKYYGSLHIDFSAFCLGNGLEAMAERFLTMLVELSDNFPNLNGHVMLQPVTGSGKSPATRYCSPRYSQPCLDGSHEDNHCLEREWYPTYYVSGVEWANVISPRAQEHFDSIPFSTEEIVVLKLSGGGLLVKSTKCINDYDVADAAELKKILYPAIYPFRDAIPISLFFNKEIRTHFDFLNHPRSDWAIIPILDGEIDIVSTYLTITRIP